MSETDFPAPVPTATRCGLCAMDLGQDPHKNIGDCLAAERRRREDLDRRLMRLAEDFKELREYVRDNRPWWRRP